MAAVAGVLNDMCVVMGCKAATVVVACCPVLPQTLAAKTALLLSFVS